MAGTAALTHRLHCGSFLALGPGCSDAAADPGPTDSAGAGSRGREQKRRQRRSVREGEVVGQQRQVPEPGQAREAGAGAPRR